VEQEIISVIVEPIYYPGIESVKDYRVEVLGAPVPPLSVGVDFIPTKYRKEFAARTYSNWKSIIHRFTGRISPQEWAEIIAKAIERNKETKSAGLVETTLPLQEPMLAIGGQIYRLTPTQLTDETKVLSIARKKLLLAAQKESQVLIEEAKKDVQGLLLAAQKKNDELSLIIAQAKEDIQKHPPAWAIQEGFAVRYVSNQWHVLASAMLAIKGFDTNYFKCTGDVVKTYKYTFPSVDPDKETAIQFWVPISSDETYAASAIYMDPLSPKLPHCTKKTACFSSASLPPKIANKIHFRVVRDEFVRVMSRVQLDSMLLDYDSWKEHWGYAVPDNLKEAFQLGDPYGKKLAEKLDQGIEVNSNQEEKETWKLVS
jgi:hypothetical protein